MAIYALLAAVVVTVLLAGRSGTSAVIPVSAGEEQAKEAPGFLLPAPYELLSTETYTPDTLYEYINGQAPRYVQFGFRRLDVTEYSVPDAEAPLIVDCYDMGRRRNAYGIFADGRGYEDEPIELGNDGFLSGNTAVFWKSVFYVNVRAPTDDDVGDFVLKAARQFADLIQDPEGNELIEFSVFPKEGLVDGALTYEKSDAFGLSYLSETFSAEYDVAADRFKLFVCYFENADEAARALDRHASYLEKNGALLERRTGEGRVVGEDPYIGHTALLAEGHILVGYAGGSYDESVRTKLLDLLRRVEAQSVR